jgi:YegS/Rv2252/BmrU family lipid kinase
MDVILLRKPVRIDTASLNGRRFLNVSTGGIGAEATAETPSQIKAALGHFAYAISGLRKLADFEPNHAVFRGGGYVLECDFLMFAVGSGLATGGGSRVTPHASTTDGLLDLCVVEQMPRRDFARIGLRLRRGEHVGEKGVHYVRLPRLIIEGTKPISVNVDGEVSDSRRLDYRARPRDLNVHVVHRPGEDVETSVSPTPSSRRQYRQPAVRRSRTPRG